MIIFFVCIFYFYFYCFKLLLFSMWPWLSVLLELPQQNIDWVSQRADIYFLTVLGLDVQDQVLVGLVSDESSIWACTWPHSHCVLIWPFPIYVERQWSLVSSSSKGEALHAPSLRHDNTGVLFPWPPFPWWSASVLLLSASDPQNLHTVVHRGCTSLHSHQHVGGVPFLHILSSTCL